VRPFVGDQLVCGFAASRAESLWLSVRYLEEGEASPRRLSRQKVHGLDGKPEAFRTGGGKAADQVSSHSVSVRL